MISLDNERCWNVTSEIPTLDASTCLSFSGLFFSLSFFFLSFSSALSATRKRQMDNIGQPTRSGRRMQDVERNNILHISQSA